MPVVDWLQQYATLLTSLGNLLLVLIWAIYLQMFYRQSQRHQKAELLIHRAQGSEFSASCLLVNMSKEVVHVQCVIVKIETSEKALVHQVTDYERISDDGSDSRQQLRQGPLQSGEYLLVGRFEDMLPGARKQRERDEEHSQLPPPLDEVEAVEVRVVAVHGPSDYLVGARRRFTVEHEDGQTRIHPERLLTEQLSARRHQPQIRRWLRDSLGQSGDGAWLQPADADAAK